MTVFSKLSRYRRLPDVVTTDVRGRRLASKSLRLAPAVSGVFVHTLEQGERLDHLAYKYYRQTRDWWRICDANPQILSPWELVGSEPRQTVRIELAWSGDDPPWAVLLADLRRSPGVEDAYLGDDDAPFPERETIGDPFRWTLTLVFNVLTATVEGLTAIVENAGFTVAATAAIGRVGKPVAIPPRA